MSAFQIGQKVVCIKEGSWRGSITGQVYPSSEAPSFKQVCVVTWAGIGVSGTAAIMVAGYSRRYGATWFRPLAYPKQDQSHDIALFTPYLAPERRSASRPVSASAASILAMATDAQTAFSGEGA